MPARSRIPDAVRRPYPTARGIALFAAGGVSLITGVLFGRTDFLFVGLVLVIAPLMAMVFVAFERPRLSVTRAVSPPTIAVGEATTIALTVRNQAARPSPASTWRDLMPARIAVHHASDFPRLAEHRVGSEGGNDTVRLTNRVRASERGFHDIGPLVIGRSDPFRLARTEFAVGGQRPLLVTPRVTELSRGELDSSRSEGSDHELLRHSIPSSDELIAREYREGDPLRRVHWRATARHDKLMVRQEEQRSNPEGWILLDTRSTSLAARDFRDASRLHEAQPDESQLDEADAFFESAVELAASIGVHLIDEGFDINVVETGRRQLASRNDRASSPGGALPRFGGNDAERSFLTGLATITPTDAANDEVVAELSSGLRRGGRRVPVFAVLAGDLAELGALATLRVFAEPAVAFIPDTSTPSTRALLGSNGWNCVGFAAGNSPADVWIQALSQQRTAGTRG